MPLWHSEATGNLVMYLYDRSQQHGNHNLSHFHITYYNEDVVFDIRGNKLAGHCKDEKGPSLRRKTVAGTAHRCGLQTALPWLRT